MKFLVFGRFANFSSQACVWQCFPHFFWDQGWEITDRVVVLWERCSCESLGLSVLQLLLRSSFKCVIVLEKTFSALGNAIGRPWDPDGSVLGIFIMMILKVCQWVCHNLWSGIIQHMPDYVILFLGINTEPGRACSQNSWNRQKTALVSLSLLLPSWVKHSLRNVRPGTETKADSEQGGRSAWRAFCVLQMQNSHFGM